MIKNKAFFLIAFLIGVCLFSILKYITIFYEKKAILSDWAQMKSQILLLNTLKEHLNNQLQEKIRIIAEKEKLQQELLQQLNIKEEKISQIQAFLDRSEEKIAELNREINLLRSQNNSLAEENRLLLEKMEKINQEYNSLLSRWQSIEELRKAIIQLKRNAHLQRKKIAQTKRIIVEGNRGYVIKEGKPTLPLKTKIEVIPAE